MPTNAEIHAAIDLYITAQRSHILNNTVAQIFHDMVDNISAGGGGTPGIDDVLAEGQALTVDRTIDLGGHLLTFDGVTEFTGSMNLTSGIKTGSNDIWMLGSAEAGAPTPTHKILITVADQPYYLSAELFVE